MLPDVAKAPQPPRRSQKLYFSQAIQNKTRTSLSRPGTLGGYMIR
jgi:hypothetical protein